MPPGRHAGLPLLNYATGQTRRSAPTELCHGLGQSRRLECLLVKFAKKLTVQRPDGSFYARAVDDEADVDRRSAVRDHRDVDLLDARKDSRGDAGREFQILSDQADQ